MRVTFWRRLRVDNDYGHPSPALLAELARLGVPVRRTDHDGDVAVVGPRDRLAVVVEQPDRVRAPTAHGRPSC